MPLSDAEIRAVLEARLATLKCRHLTIGSVGSTKDDVAHAVVVDANMRPVLRVEVDRHTGAILRTR